MSEGNGQSAGGTSRRHERRKVEIPVTIVDEIGKSYGTILFDTSDLSLGGAFMRSNLLFEVDEELGLELSLSPDRTVRARGRVVRVVREEPAGMGIAFTRLDEADREEITTFLKDKDS
jgi:hypothetical protein